MDNNNLHVIVTAHGNGRHSESSPDLTSSSLLDNNHNTVNQTKTDESISSSSSVEPRSESSLTDPIININKNDDLSPNNKYENFYDDAANDNIEADRESVLSDFISSHMVPLPQISAEPGSYEDEEDEDEDFISVTSSRDATWEDNWLFKKKKSNKTSSTVGMLVPAPKEDIRALIGDKPTDEVSDLSEVGSDTDDSSLEMVSASLEPLNDRVVNKHLIGGKNTKVILDELVDRTSMISTSSLPDNVPPYTETKNEFVVSNDGLNESQPLKISVNNCSKAISNEAINSNVSKPIAAKVEKPTKNVETPEDESIVPPPNDFTDDEKMRNLLAKFNEEQNNKTDSGDDNSSSMSPRSSISCALSAGIDRAELDAYEGITDFSVEDEEGLAAEVDTAMGESSSRRPSVIEILAAIALGPMLAVSASDDRNILTEVELSSLMELNELAMAQMSSKSPEDRRLGVIVEESSESSTTDERKIDVSEEDDLLSSPKMVMDAIRELVGKDAIRSGRYSDSSVQIEEITESSDQHEVHAREIEEVNDNAITSLSDDLGFEKIIAEDTSSISSESLHTIGSSSSSDDDFEGDSSCYFSDVKHIQEQSKDTEGTVNEFILPPPTAFCDEQSKKEKKEETHTNFEAVQTDTQINSEQPRTESETHTEDTQKQTVRRSDDNEINQISESTEMTENIQTEPETKEESVEDDKVTVVEVHHHSEEPTEVTEDISELVEASIVKECLPMSEQLQEPPDRKSEDEIESKSEDPIALTETTGDKSVAQDCEQKLVEPQSSADSKVVIVPPPLKVLSEAKLNEDQLSLVDSCEEKAISVSEVLGDNSQKIGVLEDQHPKKETKLDSVEIHTKPDEVSGEVTEKALNEQILTNEVSEENLAPSEIPIEPENLSSDGITPLAENELQPEIVLIENKGSEGPEEENKVGLEKSDEEHNSESICKNQDLTTITKEVVTTIPEEIVESIESKTEKEAVIAAAVADEAAVEEETPTEEISSKEDAEISTETKVEQTKIEDSASGDKCTKKEDENIATQESSPHLSDAPVKEQIEHPLTDVQVLESEIETVIKEETINKEINDVEVSSTTETERQTTVETVEERVTVAIADEVLEKIDENVSETQIAKEETTETVVDAQLSSVNISEDPQNTVITENTGGTIGELPPEPDLSSAQQQITDTADSKLVSSEIIEQVETSSSEVVNSTESKEECQEEKKKEEEFVASENKLKLKTSEINSTDSLETLETADVASIEPIFTNPEKVSTEESDVSSKLDLEVEKVGEIVETQTKLVEEEKNDSSASVTEILCQTKAYETLVSETKPADEPMEELQEDETTVQSESKTELASEEKSTETSDDEPNKVNQSIVTTDKTVENLTEKPDVDSRICETEKEAESIPEEKSKSLTRTNESEQESVDLSSKITTEDKIADDQAVLPDNDKTIGATEIDTASAGQAESSSKTIPTPENEVKQLNEPPEIKKEDVQTQNQTVTDDKVSEVTAETVTSDEKTEENSDSANRVIEESPAIAEELLPQAEDNKCEESQKSIKNPSTVEQSDETTNPQVLLQTSETTGEAESRSTEKVIEFSNTSNDEVIIVTAETASSETVTTESIELKEQVGEQNVSADNTKDEEIKESITVESIIETKEEILDDKTNFELENSTSVNAESSDCEEQLSASTNIESATLTTDEKVELPETEEKNLQTEVDEEIRNELPITPAVEDQNIEKASESSEEMSAAIIAPAIEEANEGAIEEETTEKCTEKEISQTEVLEEKENQLSRIEDQEMEKVSDISETIPATVSDISTTVNIVSAEEQNNDIVTEETKEKCSEKDNLKPEVPKEALNELSVTPKKEENQTNVVAAEGPEEITEAVSDFSAASITTVGEENKAIVTEETKENSSEKDNLETKVPEEAQDELSTAPKIEEDLTKVVAREGSKETNVTVSDISTASIATAVEEIKGVTEETIEMCAEEENSHTEIPEEAQTELSTAPNIEENQTNEKTAEGSETAPIATAFEENNEGITEEITEKSAEKENLQPEAPEEGQELSAKIEEDQTKETTNIVQEICTTESNTVNASITPVTEESNDSTSNDQETVRGEKRCLDHLAESKGDLEQAIEHNNEVEVSSTTEEQVLLENPQVTEVDINKLAKDDSNTTVQEESVEEKEADKNATAKDDSPEEILPTCKENPTSENESSKEALPDSTTKTQQTEKSTEEVAESLRVETVEDTQISVSDLDATSKETVVESSSNVSAKSEELSIISVTEMSTTEDLTPKTLDESKDDSPETTSKSEEKSVENRKEESVPSVKDDPMPFQTENKEVQETETAEILTELDNAKESAETATEENSSPETSLKDDNTVIKEIVRADGDTDVQEKAVEAQDVLEEVSTANVSEEEKASEISNEPVQNVDVKKSEITSDVEVPTESHDDNQVTDSSSIQLEKPNESETVEEANAEKSTTIIESKTEVLQAEEAHNVEKSDAPDQQTKDSSCEGKTEISNKLEEACDDEVKSITEEILATDELPQELKSIESKEEETLTKLSKEEVPAEEVKDDSNNVTEADSSAAEKEQLKDDNAEKKVEQVCQILNSEQSKIDQLEEKTTHSESDTTVDAPLIENEVQNEENNKCQEQTIEESCPVSKTEDGQIQSKTNMNETSLKTDDEKTEEKYEEELKVEDQETTSVVPNVDTSNALHCTKPYEEVTSETSEAIPIPEKETTNNPSSKGEVTNSEDTKIEVKDVEVGVNNEVVEEVKKVEENKDAEEFKEAEEVKDVEEVKNIEEVKDVEEHKENEESKDVQEVKENEECKDVEEVKEPEDVAGVKNVEEVKDVEKVKNVEEVKTVEEVENVEEVKDFEESKKGNENRDVEEVKEPEDVAEVKEVEEVKDIEEVGKIEEIKDVEEVRESGDLAEVKNVEVKAIQVTEIGAVVSSNEVPKENIAPSETIIPEEESAKVTKSEINEVGAEEVAVEVFEEKNESIITEEKITEEIEEANAIVVENLSEVIDNKTSTPSEQIDEAANANNVTSESVSIGHEGSEPQEKPDEENKTNENPTEEPNSPINTESEDTISHTSISETINTVKESQEAQDINKDEIAEKELKDETPIPEEAAVTSSTEEINIPDSTTESISATEVSSEILTEPEVEKGDQSNYSKDNTVQEKITEDATLQQTVENETECSDTIVDGSQNSVPAAEEVLTEKENSLSTKEISSKEEEEVRETVDLSIESETITNTATILPEEQSQEVDKTVNEEKDIIENEPTAEEVQENVSISKISVSEEQEIKTDGPIVTEEIPNPGEVASQKQDVVEELTIASSAENPDETRTDSGVLESKSSIVIVEAPQEEISISIDSQSSIATDERETETKLEEPLVDEKLTNQTPVEELITTNIPNSTNSETSQDIDETITPESQQIQQSAEEATSKESKVADEKISEVENDIPTEGVPAVSKEAAVADSIDTTDKAISDDQPDKQNAIEEITREPESTAIDANITEPADTIKEVSNPVVASETEETTKNPSDQSISKADETEIQSEIQVTAIATHEVPSSSEANIDIETHDEAIESANEIEGSDSELSFASAVEEFPEEILPPEAKSLISEKTQIEESSVVSSDEVKSNVSETSKVVEEQEEALTEEKADTQSDETVTNINSEEPIQCEGLPEATSIISEEAIIEESSAVDVKEDEVKSEVTETSNVVGLQEATLKEEQTPDTILAETVNNEINESSNPSVELLQPEEPSVISAETTIQDSCVIDVKVDEVKNEVSGTKDSVEIQEETVQSVDAVNIEVSETKNSVEIQEETLEEKIADSELKETAIIGNNEETNPSEELLQPEATSVISEETTTKETCDIDVKEDEVKSEVTETSNAVEVLGGTLKEEIADTILEETVNNENKEAPNQSEEILQPEAPAVISEETTPEESCVFDVKVDEEKVEVLQTSSTEEIKEETVDSKLDESINEKETTLDDLSIVQEVLANVIDSLQPEETTQANDGLEDNKNAVSEESETVEVLKKDTVVAATSVLETTEVIAQEPQNISDKAEEPPDMDKCNDAALSEEQVDPTNVTVDANSEDLVVNKEKVESVDTKETPTQEVLEVIDTAINEPIIDSTNLATTSEEITNNVEEQQTVQINSEATITDSNTILADAKCNELILSNDQNESVETVLETNSTCEAKQEVAEVLESTTDSNDLRTSTTETEVNVEEPQAKALEVQNVTSKEETKALDSTEIKENETVLAKEVEEALEVTEQIVEEEISASSTVETKIIDETSQEDIPTHDTVTVDSKSSNEVKPPIEVLTATCKIITHPPLEKTESLIASAQYLYEKISDPILEPTPEVTTPSLAEELRMADTIQLLPKAECVIPQTISCESRCFASDPQPVATATEEQSNAQDAAQGSIAEREYKKWYNAVDMPNNPYSVEALRRRLSGGPDRVLDLPNISPCIEDKPLQLGESSNTDADMKGQERDYARYSRDYYINDAKHASGITKKSLTSPTETPSPTPTASSIELEEQNDSTPKTPTTTPVKELCHKLEKQGRIEADLYLATPVRVIEDIPEAFADALETSTPKTLTTEAVSRHSSDTSSNLTNASLTPSEDSDTIRIYDLKKQETRLVKESAHTTTITVPKSPEKKIRPTELSITPTLGPPVATISSKSSTPTSFKFLQPKRKLINPSQVLSVDQETAPITPYLPEKPVIEAEVAHAMPSVKALARAFLMTTTTTSSSENKWRKARAKSPLQFFKLSTATVQKQEEPVLVPVVPDTASQGSEDATIASDLSSLETDPPSRIEGDSTEANENQERVVLSGCLRNNIAFFENLKNK